LSSPYSLNFRADVQVLRALAVLLVIFFHAKVPGFEGGFLGVDIFFVISGFWMSAILIKEIESGAFSFSNFYERRLRRILPALYVTLLIVLIVSWFALWPRDFDAMSKVMAAAVLFLANAVIRNQADDYFAPELDSHPLLHIWSLSLEEQFYLLFPLVLLMIYKSPYVIGRVLIWLIPIVSFYTAIHFYQINPTATFYHLPARIWEFWLGYGAARWVRSNKGMHHVTYWLAILMLFSSVLLANETFVVPGWGSLAPAVSTAIILSSAGSNLSFQSIFWKVAVWIGGISYSLYLLHQPILSFLRLRGYDNWLVLMGITLLLGLAGSQLMKRFIEDPFRDTTVITKKVFHFSMVGAGLFFLIVSFISLKTDFLKELMLSTKFNASEEKILRSVFRSTEENMFLNMKSDGCFHWAKEPNKLNKDELKKCATQYGKGVLIIGDSHAMNLFNIIAYSGSVPFAIGIADAGTQLHDEASKDLYAQVERFISDNKKIISKVIYHQSGSYLISDESGRVDSRYAFEGKFNGFDLEKIEMVKSHLNSLKDRANLNVVWIGPFVEYRKEIHEIKDLQQFLSLNPVSEDLFLKLDKLLEGKTKNQKFAFEKFNSVFIQPENTFSGDCFIFLDRDHFSSCGERYLSASLTDAGRGLLTNGE